MCREHKPLSRQHLATPTPHTPPCQLINPSETFGDIVIDYNYVECSSACITALLSFAAQHPEHRTNEIEMSVHRGVRYIKRYAWAPVALLCGAQDGVAGVGPWGCHGVQVGRWTAHQPPPPAHAPNSHPSPPLAHSIQRPDGSWYGNWAVSFTYGTWFGAVALAAAGEDVHGSACLRRACAFLLSKQRQDGGWGESYLSSQTKVRR